MLHPVSKEPLSELIVSGMKYVWLEREGCYTLRSEYEKGLRPLHRHEMIDVTHEFEARWTDEKRMKMLRCLAKDGYQGHIAIIFMIISNSSAHLEKSSRIRIELWKAGYVF